MKTGIELIAIERQEQVEKHGFTTKSDLQYSEGELIQVARFCLGIDEYPDNWDLNVGERISKKPHLKQLIIAGALISAEIDRLNAIGKQSNYEV